MAAPENLTRCQIPYRRYINHRAVKHAMLRTGHSNKVITATVLVLIAGYVCSLAVNWPGHLEFDSIRQLLEGRRGVYSNWHPPLMSFLLGAADAIVPGGALFVLLNTTLAFGAMTVLVFLVQKPIIFSPVIAAICVALPQLFLFQAIVWKDILFGDLTLAGFALIGLIGSTPNLARYRIVLKILAHLVIALAILSRQNGVLILPCAAIAWCVSESRSCSMRQAAMRAALFAVLTALLAYSIHLGLQTRASKALGPREQIEDLQLYDIAGMLRHNPRLGLPILEARAPGLAAQLRDNGSRLYTPAAQDRLIDYPPLRRFLVPSLAPVNEQWQALVRSNLAGYLSVRAQDFLWLLSGGGPEVCNVYQLGVNGNPRDLQAAKLAPRYDRRDRWLQENYAAPLLATPIFSHAFYAILGAFCFVYLIWRRRPADLVMACLIAAMALYSASFFFISISCEYRYLFPLDLGVIACAFYLMIDVRRPS